MTYFKGHPVRVGPGDPSLKRFPVRVSDNVQFLRNAGDNQILFCGSIEDTNRMFVGTDVPGFSRGVTRFCTHGYPLSAQNVLVLTRDAIAYTPIGDPYPVPAFANAIGDELHAIYDDLTLVYADKNVDIIVCSFEREYMFLSQIYTKPLAMGEAPDINDLVAGEQGFGYSGQVLFYNISTLSFFSHFSSGPGNIPAVFTDNITNASAGTEPTHYQCVIKQIDIPVGMYYTTWAGFPVGAPTTAALNTQDDFLLATFFTQTASDVRFSARQATTISAADVQSFFGFS